MPYTKPSGGVVFEHWNVSSDMSQVMQLVSGVGLHFLSGSPLPGISCAARAATRPTPTRAAARQIPAALNQTLLLLMMQTSEKKYPNLANRSVARATSVARGGLKE